MADNGKIRLSFDITPELNEQIEDIASAVGGSKTEVFRKAIALLRVAVDAKQSGRKFGIAEKDQPLATEIVGL
ncbi:MAG: DNA-binding protein [Gemmatimonadaceae bacterium]|nr:DNA-binding protein [Gemmatimonadaceae bacterium]NUP71621.1 DNA-binding protein [Gemmatimonadaceae bacterium]